MQAFEFVADYRNGMIAVPENIREKINHTGMKVILMCEEPNKGNHKPEFKALRLKTKGFVFNREEAHEL
jgi:hypothetical protein